MSGCFCACLASQAACTPAPRAACHCRPLGPAPPLTGAGQGRSPARACCVVPRRQGLATGLVRSPAQAGVGGATGGWVERRAGGVLPSMYGGLGGARPGVPPWVSGLFPAPLLRMGAETAVVPWGGGPRPPLRVCAAGLGPWCCFPFPAKASCISAGCAST